LLADLGLRHVALVIQHDDLLLARRKFAPVADGGHTALGCHPPASRVPNLSGQYT
jgi:hypothetical protein